MKKIMKLGVIALIASAFAFTACENEAADNSTSAYDVDLAKYYSFTPAVTDWSKCITIIPAGETIKDGAKLTITLEPQSNVASWGATFKYLYASYAGTFVSDEASANLTQTIDGATTATAIGTYASGAVTNDCFNVTGKGTHTVTITLTGGWLTLVELHGLGLTGDGTYKVASAKLDY